MEVAMRTAEEEGKRAGHPAATLAARSTVKRLLLPLVERLKEMAQDGQVEEALRLAQLVTRLIQAQPRST
jgi:glutamyl-tRNA reductase